jgi:uncharacterized protein
MIPLRLVIGTVVLLARSKPARWYVSDGILSEYATVLARRELAIRRGLRQQLLQLIKNRTHTVVPSHLPLVTADRGDNIFVECADAARADYLITGNHRYFPGFWKSTKIISSREFRNIIAPHLIG